MSGVDVRDAYWLSTSDAVGRTALEKWELTIDFSFDICLISRHDYQ